MRDLTPRIVLELLAHEGLVREAYRDSTGVWTWSVGITDASGHRVYPRYKDNPQPLSHCLEVYVWLLRTRYLPQVIAAFGAYDPAEHELGAALSFHWNTGAIARASWVGRFTSGDRDGARASFLSWARPLAVAARRAREAALLFDGQWSGDGSALVYAVSKPSYHPAGGQRQDLREAVDALLSPPSASSAASPEPALAPKPATPSGGGPASRPNWFGRLFGS
ncbi:MAG: hypothetical protein KGL48_00580 [Sphingomonadales bacterium]|nr:hypothetical protein [Sphingomonadales bacterium]MDE2567855.1 hypothetical protein [Sphingomonadales bacterium]